MKCVPHTPQICMHWCYVPRVIVTYVTIISSQVIELFVSLFAQKEMDVCHACFEFHINLLILQLS